MELSLDDLLSLSAAGDADAFRVFYVKTWVRVSAVCRRLLRGEAEAEDTAQDVFVEAWTKAAQFDSSRGSAISWVLRIAHHRAVDRIRTAESERRRQAIYGQWVWLPVDEPPDGVVHACDITEVRAAIDRLSPLRREALLYAYFTDHSYEQASNLLGIPVGTYKSRVRDAVLAVRTCLTSAA